MVRTNMRFNLKVIVQVAREYSKQLTSEKLIEMRLYFLGDVLIKTEEKHVIQVHREAAAKVRKPQDGS